MPKHSYFYLVSIFFCLIFSTTDVRAQSEEHRQTFELKIYHLENDRQIDQVENYLENGYLPAMHRLDVDQIGVFKPVGQDTLDDKRIYVLTPYESAEDVKTFPKKLEKDEDYVSNSAEYLDAAHDNPPYQRIETILLEAFSDAPVVQTPDLDAPKTERIYELRSYESATEALNINKVAMFNEGDEIGIFERLDFNAVFYGNVIAGPNMPNLMYMTSFEDMDDRDAHWDAFSEDDQWEELSAEEKYENNVSHIDIYHLHGTEYSDL